MDSAKIITIAEKTVKIIAIGGGYLLLPTFGIVSIPLAFFSASLVELIILLILLPYRLKKLPSTPNFDGQTEPHQQF